MATPVNIGSAYIAIEMDDTKLRQGIAGIKQKLNDGVKIQEGKLEKQFDREFNAVLRNSQKISRKVAESLRVAFTAGMAGVGIAMAKLFTSDSRAGQLAKEQWGAVSKGLDAQLARIGFLLSKSKIFGKDMYQWIEKFSNFLSKLTKEDIQKFVNALTAIAVAMGAMKVTQGMLGLLDFGKKLYDTYKGLDKLFSSPIGSGTINAASNIVGGAVGGVIGASGASKAASEVSKASSASIPFIKQTANVTNALNNSMNAAQIAIAKQFEAMNKQISQLALGGASGTKLLPPSRYNMPSLDSNQKLLSSGNNLKLLSGGMANAPKIENAVFKSLGTWTIQDAVNEWNKNVDNGMSIVINEKFLKSEKMLLSSAKKIPISTSFRNVASQGWSPLTDVISSAPSKIASTISSASKEGISKLNYAITALNTDIRTAFKNMQLAPTGIKGIAAWGALAVVGVAAVNQALGAIANKLNGIDGTTAQNAQKGMSILSMMVDDLIFGVPRMAEALGKIVASKGKNARKIYGETVLGEKTGMFSEEERDQITGLQKEYDLIEKENATGRNYKRQNEIKNILDDFLEKGMEEGDRNKLQDLTSKYVKTGSPFDLQKIKDFKDEMKILMGLFTEITAEERVNIQARRDSWQLERDILKEKADAREKERQYLEKLPDLLFKEAMKAQEEAGLRRKAIMEKRDEWEKTVKDREIESSRSQADFADKWKELSISFGMKGKSQEEILQKARDLDERRIQNLGRMGYTGQSVGYTEAGKFATNLQTEFAKRQEGMAKEILDANKQNTRALEDSTKASKELKDAFDKFAFENSEGVSGVF